MFLHIILSCSLFVDHLDFSSVVIFQQNSMHGHINQVFKILCTLFFSFLFLFKQIYVNAFNFSFSYSCLNLDACLLFQNFLKLLHVCRFKIINRNIQNFILFFIFFLSWSFCMSCFLFITFRIGPLLNKSLYLLKRW